MNKRLLLVSLNELNFEFIEYYASKGKLPTFKLLFEQYGYQKTFSENTYHLLEPWIQWVSVHTGKTFEEHRVFRLGDIANRNDLDQVWEILERKGLKVGAISPFNAKNNLKNGSFFVPDPWTNTLVSGDVKLKSFYSGISKIVNNHSNNKLSKKALFELLKGFLRYVPVKEYLKYVKLAGGVRKKAFMVTVLDELLSDVFFYFFKKEKPDFSSLFLNGAAHIQHHYMFNSKAYKGDQVNPDWYCPSREDPLLDILESYDRIINKILRLNHRVIFATGLHQKPHNKKTYYWRLKDHAKFLKLLNVNSYSNVFPRMSRDFLIEFTNDTDTTNAELLLTRLKSSKDGIPLFSVDNRGNSLFIELVYPDIISKEFQIEIDGKPFPFDFFDFVSFLAIKNGEHDGIGYLIDTTQKVASKQDPIAVTSLFNRILSSYN